ncbi:CPBP family intramembrane glutamic endopeptidase [Corynebacterium sp. 335C]
MLLAGVAAGVAVAVAAAIAAGPAAMGWALPVLGVTMLAGLALGLRLRGLRAGDLGLAAPARPWHLLWQIPLAWLSPVLLGGTVVTLLPGDMAEQTNTAAVTDAAADPLLLAGVVATAVLLAPLAEEILFRRVLLGWAEGRFGLPAAVAGTAVLFGVAHGIPAVMVLMTCLGASLALLTAAQRSIVPALAVHMLNNAVACGVALSLMG